MPRSGNVVEQYIYSTNSFDYFLLIFFFFSSFVLIFDVICLNHIITTYSQHNYEFLFEKKQMKLKPWNLLFLTIFFVSLAIPIYIVAWKSYSYEVDLKIKMFASWWNIYFRIHYVVYLLSISI